MGTSGVVSLAAGGIIGTADNPIDPQVGGVVQVTAGGETADGKSAAFTDSLDRDALVEVGDSPGRIEVDNLDFQFQDIAATIRSTEAVIAFRSFAALAVLASPTRAPASNLPGVVILDGGIKGHDGSMLSSDAFTLELDESLGRTDPAGSALGQSSSGRGAPREERTQNRRGLSEYFLRGRWPDTLGSMRPGVFGILLLAMLAVAVQPPVVAVCCLTTSRSCCDSDAECCRVVEARVAEAPARTELAAVAQMIPIGHCDCLAIAVVAARQMPLSDYLLGESPPGTAGGPGIIALSLRV